MLNWWLRGFSGASAVLLLCSTIVAFETIVDNGPSSNRVDIVFLGDGYTSADHAAGIYDGHVNSYLGHMFANDVISEPFYRYRNFFNIHQIDVVSNESGADRPDLGIEVDTALDAAYSGRLLTVSGSKADAIRETELSGAGFVAEMQFVAVNSDVYGGSGGSWAVFAGGDVDAFEVAIHEMAHSFSRLADEYEYGADRDVPGGPFTGGEPWEVNVTIDDTGAKWSRWLGYEHPNTTPETDIGVVGVYEGGKYHSEDIYRASEESKMRSLNYPFNAIAREKIILDIYELVDPLDSYLDNSGTLLDPPQIFVDTVDSDVISVQWSVDGSIVPGASGETFSLIEHGYGIDTYEVEARAYDPTGFDAVDGWVRMNQAELQQTVSWTVTLTVVPEPSSALLATVALILLGPTLFGRRRKRQSVSD